MLPSDVMAGTLEAEPLHVSYPAGAVLAAVAGMASYYGMMTQWFGLGCDSPDDEVIETFTRIMMQGIRKNEI